MAAIEVHTAINAVSKLCRGQQAQGARARLTCSAQTCRCQGTCETSSLKQFLLRDLSSSWVSHIISVSITPEGNSLSGPGNSDHAHAVSCHHFRLCIPCFSLREADTCSPTTPTVHRASSWPLWFGRSLSPLDPVQGERPRFFRPLCSIHQFNLPLKPVIILKAKNLHIYLPLYSISTTFPSVSIWLRAWIRSLLLCWTLVFCPQSSQVIFLSSHFPYRTSIILFRAKSWVCSLAACSPGFCLLSWNIPPPSPGQSGFFILPEASLPLNHDSEFSPQTGELSLFSKSILSLTSVQVELSQGRLPWSF